MKNSSSKQIFEYLKELANLNFLAENLLGRTYEKISFIGEDVVLSKYLNPSLVNKKREANIPIFPFGCNNSQYKAVKNVLENQISIIQ